MPNDGGDNSSPRVARFDSGVRAQLMGSVPFVLASWAGGFCFRQLGRRVRAWEPWEGAAHRRPGSTLSSWLTTPYWDQH